MSDAPKDGERVHSEPQRRVKPWTRWKALHIRLEAALRIYKCCVFASISRKKATIPYERSRKAGPMIGVK